jgi:hypothetical protein
VVPLGTSARHWPSMVSEALADYEMLKDVLWIGMFSGIEFTVPG